MTNIETTTLASRLRSVLEDSGLPEAVGGTEAFASGMDALRSGLLTVAAELVNAQQHDVDLSDAVFDTERFPHTCQMHGTFADMLDDTNIPKELEAWVMRIVAAGPFPDAPVISHAIATIATSSPNALHRMLARFALFELLCLQERLMLKKDGVELLALNGRRRDVEILAEQEVNVACELATSSLGLLEIEDPLALIAQMTTTCLAQYVDILREELSRVSCELGERLERRNKILAAVARVDAADGILILNVADDTSGEERLTPSQLRRLHPVLLGELSDDAIYKRIERMPERVREGRRGETRAFGDMLIAAMAEVQS